MIDSLAWNDESNMLAALADGKLMIWYYPNAAYVDKSLLQKTVFERNARSADLLSPDIIYINYLVFFALGCP